MTPAEARRAGALGVLRALGLVSPVDGAYRPSDLDRLGAFAEAQYEAGVAAGRAEGARLLEQMAARCPDREDPEHVQCSHFGCGTYRVMADDLRQGTDWYAQVDTATGGAR